MPIEAHTITEVNAATARTGSTYYKVNTAEGLRAFSFDPKVSRDLLDNHGQRVNISVEHDSKGSKITAFHGVAESSAATAAPTPAAASGAARGAGSGGFKKDPIGIVLGSRQTALNAAVALVPEGASLEVVVDTAQRFNEFLLQGLSPHILSDGLHVSHVLPWREDLRKAENAQAKAALPEPEPVPDVAGADPDDGIPF